MPFQTANRTSHRDKNNLKNEMNRPRAGRTKRNPEIKNQALTSTIATKVRSGWEGVEESTGSEIIGITGIDDLMRTGERRGNSGPEMRRRE